MSSVWALKTLGEFCPFKYGKGLPERDRKPGVYGVFSSAGLVGSHEAAYVNSPGVVIGRKGTVGSVTYSSEPFWPIDTAFYVEDQPDIRDVRFTYYLLKTLNLHLMNTDSAVPGLNRDNAHALEVHVPPMSEQKSIADFLRHLDDRITLLGETNTTLEAIAQALFKSWFVDFDPVHAKMQGRAPEGMIEATAALFPDSFEDSEQGPVPKGWPIASVADVADIIKGKSYSSKDLVAQNTTALVTLKSFERGGGFRMDGFKPYLGTFKPTQVVTPGDLIVAYTDVTQAAELIGKPAIVVGIEEHHTLVASLDVGIVRPDFLKCGRQFLYGLFKTDSFQSHTLAHTSGTTVLHLSKDGVGSYRFPLPSFGVISVFEKIASDLAKRRQTNSDQIRTLSALRDTLLPRLISGELRISDTAKHAEWART
jgi:type I restriction enzyme S subunit